LKKIEISVLIGLVITILIGSITTFAADCSQIREDVLRLHILANSDTDEDQALKLRVRDRILSESGELFENPATLEEAKSSAADHIEEVRQIAQDEVYANGYDYQVNAEIVNMYFTTRQYETFTLPAGMYDAVRITIGEAKGHNWWCVLYPPLCLPAAQPEEKMEQALTQDEADLVTRNPQYEVRFAVVEWFEDLKNALNW
jgi:stage II sporulation protein R